MRKLNLIINYFLVHTIFPIVHFALFSTEINLILNYFLARVFLDTGGGGRYSNITGCATFLEK